MWQRPLVVEEAPEIATVDPTGAGSAPDEIVGFVRGRASDAFPDYCQLCERGNGLRRPSHAWQKARCVASRLRAEEGRNVAFGLQVSAKGRVVSAPGEAVHPCAFLCELGAGKCAHSSSPEGGLAALVGRQGSTKPEGRRRGELGSSVGIRCRRCSSWMQLVDNC
jgi:hypothetical protein